MAGSDEFKGSLQTSSQGTFHPDVIYYPFDASITGEESGRLAKHEESPTSQHIAEGPWQRVFFKKKWVAEI